MEQTNYVDPWAIPETVRVKFDCEQGFCIVNKSDFNPEKHELFDAPVQDASTGAKPAWQK